MAMVIKNLIEAFIPSISLVPITPRKNVTNNKDNKIYKGWIFKNSKVKYPWIDNKNSIKQIKLRIKDIRFILILIFINVPHC